jgi:hypothetical protein
MPPLPPPNARLAPSPAESQRSFPWRFRIGDPVYVNGQFPDASFIVTGGELWVGFPHLYVLDSDGKAWRVPQLHCSSKPITAR